MLENICLFDKKSKAQEACGQLRLPRCISARNVQSLTLLLILHAKVKEQDVEKSGNTWNFNFCVSLDEMDEWKLLLWWHVLFSTTKMNWYEFTAALIHASLWQNTFSVWYDKSPTAIIVNCICEQISNTDQGGCVLVNRFEYFPVV